MDVIDFLERMGQDASLRVNDASVFDKAMDEARLEPAVREAIRAKDSEQLQDLLGTGPMFAVLMVDQGDA